MLNARPFSILMLAASLIAGSVPAFAEDQPITFEFTDVGDPVDPTGLFTDEELAEGGSDVQPSISYATFRVDGGRVDLAILADKWCGTQECPYRFRLTTDSGMVLNSFSGDAYGMVCQGMDSMTFDPIDLTITACGFEIDLKAAR